jgi:hypothetical protein
MFAMAVSVFIRDDVVGAGDPEGALRHARVQGVVRVLHDPDAAAGTDGDHAGGAVVQST